jgi:hypothetical protein
MEAFTQLLQEFCHSIDWGEIAADGLVLSVDIDGFEVEVLPAGLV